MFSSQILILHKYSTNYTYKYKLTNNRKGETRTKDNAIGTVTHRESTKEQVPL